MNKNKYLLIGVLAIMTLASCASTGALTYPLSKKVDVKDDYHGQVVADPYRWLEEADSQEVKEWIAAQNELTGTYLAKIPGRKAMKERLTAIWQYDAYSVPKQAGGRLFFFKQSGLQNQPLFMMQEDGSSEAEVLIDANTLSKDGTVEIASVFPNDDGRYVAYATSGSGSDWQTIYIYDVEKRANTTDRLDWCKFSDVAWADGSSGFYYNRYDDPKNVSKEHMTGGNKVWYHALGTLQAEDRLIYEEENDLNMIYDPMVTDDGRYLVIHIFNGTDPENKVIVKDLQTDAPFVTLFDKADAMYQVVANEGHKFILHSNLNAPKGRIIAKELGSNEISELVPEQTAVLDGVKRSKDRLVAAYMEDAAHRLKVFALDGRLIDKVALPGLGSISGLKTSFKESTVYFGFESFLSPRTVYRFDSGNLASQPAVVWPINLPVDTSAFETKQYFVTSKDGTRVPIFVTAKKDLAKNGKNPAILYGYGGFNINLTPFFKVHRLYWLEQGGVYVVANLRGGTEYGEEWHKAGMLGNKQNVFDDFIAAAKYLIAEKFTSPEKLAINGGSNGGLLVTATLLQAPELFGAAVAQVPVTDMLRYHRFTVGRFWVGEYGNAEENSEHFKFMYAYSPLHNVPSSIKAPPTLITTADTDDRVVPAHSFKFAATLQAAQKGKNPVLLRIDSKAGHGHGKPTDKQIEEMVDIYSFIMKNLKMP